MNTKKSQTQGTLCVLLKHILHSRCEEPRPEPHSNDASAPAPRLPSTRLAPSTLYLSSPRPSPPRAHRLQCLGFDIRRPSRVVQRAPPCVILVRHSVRQFMSDCLVRLDPSIVRPVFDSAPPIRPRTIDDIYILSCVTTNTVEHSFILDEKVPVRMSRQVETCAH